MEANTETPATYDAGRDREDAVLVQAAAILERRLTGEKISLSSPHAVRDYLRMKLASAEREEFMAIWLDAQNRVMGCATISTGTLTQTSVFPREVVKESLRVNAAAVIFAHNHPSGIAEPSRADETLTQALKKALALVDVRVLDHFIVGGSAVMSFAERGLL